MNTATVYVPRDSPAGRRDLDQRFEPEQPARAVAHQLQRDAATGTFGLQGVGHLVGADCERGRVARDIDGCRVHAPALTPALSRKRERAGVRAGA